MKNQKGFSFVERKTRSGFTLIELIVVMAILGLLATVGLASFRSSQIKGRDAQRKNDLGQLQRGLEAYYNDKGRYPSTLPSGEWRDPDVSSTLYMKSVPIDPTAYRYAYESNGTAYKIFAHLENQKDIDLKKMECVKGLGKNCDTGITCNYGVSSANLGICDAMVSL